MTDVSKAIYSGDWELYPRDGYHGLYIEFKYGKNRLTSEQREFLDYANINGYKTGVAYSAEAGIEILRAYLGDV